MEIERKWIINDGVFMESITSKLLSPKNQSDNFRCTVDDIWRAHRTYFEDKDGIEIRAQKIDSNIAKVPQDRIYSLTVKSTDNGLCRNEYIYYITNDVYNAITQMTGYILNFNYIKYDVSMSVRRKKYNLSLEFTIIKVSDLETIYLEIEFPDEDTANKFKFTNGLKFLDDITTEVTDDPFHKMRNVYTRAIDTYNSNIGSMINSASNAIEVVRKISTVIDPKTDGSIIPGAFTGGR